MDQFCRHIIFKAVKCCGSQKTQEIPWCEKLNTPLQGRICKMCHHYEKSTSDSQIQKLKKILQGYVHLGLENILPVSGSPKKNKRLFVQQRLEACQTCQHRSYLTFSEYNDWIRTNGGIAKFIKEIHVLHQWPPLPDNKDPNNGKLFCRLCKCLLAAKANQKSEQCPVGHPAWDLEKES